jgi:hypothetical protein
MWVNIYSIGIYADLKYSNITDSLILLNPAYFNSLLLVFLMYFGLKRPGFMYVQTIKHLCHYLSF